MNGIVQPSEVKGPSKESEGSTRLNQTHLAVLVPCARVLARRTPRELIRRLKAVNALSSIFYFAFLILIKSPSPAN